MRSKSELVTMCGLAGKTEPLQSYELYNIIPVGLDDSVYLRIAPLVDPMPRVDVIHVAGTGRIDAYGFNESGADVEIIARSISSEWDAERADVVYRGPLKPRVLGDDRAKLKEAKKSIESLREQNMRIARDIVERLPVFQGDKAQAEELLARKVDYIPLKSPLRYLEASTEGDLQWIGFTYGADALIHLTPHTLGQYGRERFFATPVRFKER